jgi:hypothetical protein
MQAEYDILLAPIAPALYYIWFPINQNSLSDKIFSV